MKDLYIIGAGGFGREVAWLVERVNEVKSTWNLRGFIDDDAAHYGKLVDGYPVVGNCDYLMGLQQEVWTVCAVGTAKTRKNIVEKLRNCPYLRFATIIDPSVLLSKHVTIGEGSIICAGTILTVDISIGNHVIINLDCTLGHDDIISDFVTIYPSVNVSGNVTIGQCCELGTGVQIIQGKTITDSVIIGAGGVVIRDVECPGTYKGVPIKMNKTNVLMGGRN